MKINHSIFVMRFPWGWVDIENNTLVTNLNGLSSLTFIGGHLEIDGNIALSNLTSILGNLWINNNVALANLNGLANLTSIGGYLSISNNTILTNIVIDLIIVSSTLAITGIGGSTLMANIPDAEYQWLDCNNNSNPIEGATNQEFTATEIIRDYAVQVTLDGCTVISDCFFLNTTGIVDDEFTKAVSIQPNPANNHVFVDLGKDHQATSLTLRNILGQTILRQVINTSNEFHFEIGGAVGLYLLEIESNSGQIATFKVLKN